MGAAADPSRVGASVRRVLAFLLILACALPASAEDSLEVLVGRLQGTDSSQWSTAYTELQRRKDPRVIPLLLKAAPTLQTTPQSYAVYIINALPDSKPKRNALRAMTKMEPPYLRARAVKVLYDRGEPDMGKLAVKIAKGVREDETLATLVLSAFTYLRAPELQAELRRWIGESPTDRIFSRLVYYFHMVQDRKHVIPLFEARVGDESPTVRGLSAAYLYAYGASGSAGAHGKVVAEALATGDIEYSEFLYIDYMLTNAVSMSDEILEAIAGRVEKEQGYYGARLLRALGRGGYGGTVALAKKLIDDDDKQVSKAAFEVLAAVPGGFSRDALAGLLDSDNDARRLMAAESLRRADDPSGMPAVISILAESDDALTRRDAARILGDFRTPAAVEPLLRALEDKDNLVRNYAASSLQRVWNTLFPYRRMDLRAAGFEYMAPEATRKAGIGRLKAWWKAHKDARW